MLMLMSLRFWKIMKINKLLVNDTYNETPQVNPIRWKILYKDGENLTDQSGWMKCKDFFNDLVAAKYGRFFFVYGFDNQKIKWNEEGLYFLLKYISDKPRFFHNLTTINERLVKDLGDNIEMKAWDNDKDEVVILIPSIIFTNTYYFSLLAMLIRVSNYDVQMSSWDDFFNEMSPLVTKENAFNSQTMKITKAWGFVLPEKHLKHWWWYNEQYNSEAGETFQQPTSIHNNGCAQRLMFETV